jgi:hypothetical protein
MRLLRGGSAAPRLPKTAGAMLDDIERALLRILRTVNEDAPEA